MRVRQSRNREGGYVLLSLLVAVAVVGIMLARTLPRDAMRAQRTREEKLVARGEQYARAIEIYFREHKKYPESLDDLEDTNGVRYLRRRYQDPITGEDEWRLIHMGSDGRFKDSLLYDAAQDDPTREGESGLRFSRSERDRILSQVASAPDPGGFAGADRARAIRQSAAPDNPLAQANGPASALGVAGGVAPADPNAPPQVGPDGRPIQPDYSQMLPSQIPQNAGQPPPGAPPGAQHQMPPAAAGVDPYGQAAPPGGFGRQGRSRADAFGRAAAPSPGAAGVSAPTASPDAAQMLQRLLTTPRPGGLSGLQGQGAAQQQAGQAVFPEGVAGVASKSKQTGVKVYRGKEQYNEWEFVYDYRSDGFGPAGGGPEQTAGAAGEPAALSPNQPGLDPAGGFSTPPAGYPTAVQPGQAPPNDPRLAQPGVAAPLPIPGAGPYLPPTVPAAGDATPGSAAPETPSPYPTPQPEAPTPYPYPSQPGDEGAYPALPGAEGLYPPTTAPQQEPENRRGRQLPRSRFGSPVFPGAPEQNAPPQGQQ